MSDATVSSGASDALHAGASPDAHELNDPNVLNDATVEPMQDVGESSVSAEARVMALNAGHEADYGLAWGRVDAFAFPPSPGDSAALDALRSYSDHDDAGQYSVFNAPESAETRPLPNIIPVPTPALIGLGGLIVVIVTRRRVMKRL